MKYITISDSVGGNIRHRRFVRRVKRIIHRVSLVLLLSLLTFSIIFILTALVGFVELEIGRELL